MYLNDLEGHGIRVVLRDMPGNAKAFVRQMGDGYTIVVNAALGPAEQKKAVQHELEHIERGDLYNTDYAEYAY